ncbi:MAG: alpha/beta hydrolase [Dehalococcoidia bacterium]
MAASNVTARADVVFGRGGGRDLLCDVYAPEPAGTPRPAAILFHGGGWQRGSRGTLRERAVELAAYGVIVVAAEYRLTGEAPWPAHIHDAKAVLRWVRANAADLGVHPDQIALIGFSAGAQLALLAAGTPGQPAFSGDGGHPEASEVVNAVVGFFPPIRFVPGAERTNEGVPASAGDSIGLGLSEEDLRLASPITHVGPAYPPTLLLHGTADEVIAYRSSTTFFDALRAAGVRADLRLYDGLRHEFVRMDGVMQLCMADVALFLQRSMVDPARFDVPQAVLFGQPAAAEGAAR